MVFLLSLAVLLLAILLWGSWRLVRSLPVRVTVWLVMLLSGVAILLSGDVPATPVARFLVQAWAWCITLMPFAWIATAIATSWRRRS